MNFNDLPLHDASLFSINYDWENKTASITGSFYNRINGETQKFTLEFAETSSIVIPHKEDWGASSQINKVVLTQRTEFIIAMQSGDKISITAKEFRFSSKTR